MYKRMKTANWKDSWIIQWKMLPGNHRGRQCQS